MLTNSTSHNNLKPSNRASLSGSTSNLSKTQTFKSSKVTTGFGLSTANALAMIMGGESEEMVGVGKRVHLQ